MLRACLTLKFHIDIYFLVLIASIYVNMWCNSVKYRISVIIPCRVLQLYSTFLSYLLTVTQYIAIVMNILVF